MIRFESDYLEGCHPYILERMQETNFEQTLGYSVDYHTEKAKEKIKKACGIPDAEVHILVGGTQTNTTVISAALRPHQGVLAATNAHINVHETGAIEHSGHKVLALQADEGKITASKVKDAMEVHLNDESFEHTVQPGMVYISFPSEYGTIYSLSELESMREVCDRYGLLLFIDGARLGYGLMSDVCDVTLKDIAALSDVFYIGGTKQGALFGEAVVIRNHALKKDFRYFIKQNGGLLAKGRLLGIQFEVLFEDELYFKLAANADRQAERITAAFAGHGIKLFMNGHTNQVFPILEKAQMDALALNFGFEVWEKLEHGLTAVRFCTSWATTDEMTDKLIEAIGRL